MAFYPESAFCINFRMKRRLNFGEALYIAGDIEELGCWEIGKALRMTWNEVVFFLMQERHLDRDIDIANESSHSVRVQVFREFL